MYCPSGHCLCRTMQARSRQVWDDLQDAEALGTPYHEDTVTQSLALHLNRYHPGENRVHVFTRSKEGKNGSDFIWIFFDHDLRRYFYIAVQAKRLYKNGRYDAFKVDQVKKIRRYAQVAGALPIYLTYNYPPVLRGLWAEWRQRRRQWPIRALDYQRDLGLIYFHVRYAENVQDGQLSANDIAQSGRPMWSVFCTCNSACTGDALKDLREALIAQADDADTPGGVLHETPPALRTWKSGETVQEQQLLEPFGLHERAPEHGFSPSFMLGTTLGNTE